MCRRRQCPWFCRVVCRVLWVLAGISAAVRWIFGRNTGDLRVMKRSGMAFTPTAATDFLQAWSVRRGTGRLLALVGARGPRCSDFWRPGETGAVAW
jgi:hypothetical protein